MQIRTSRDAETLLVQRTALGPRYTDIYQKYPEQSSVIRIIYLYVVGERDKRDVLPFSS